MLFGVGEISADGKVFSDVPLCLDVAKARLGYQFASMRSLQLDSVCFDQIVTITGKFASPWGYFTLLPRAQWTSYSIGGSGFSIYQTPLSSLIGETIDWSWRWLTTSQKIELEVPFNHHETIFVGRSIDLHRSINLSKDLNMVGRKASISLLGELDMDFVYPRECCIASILVGSALAPHSHQSGSKLTLFGNALEENISASRPLFFNGYPMRSHEIEVIELPKLASVCVKKFSKPLQDGPGLLEVLQYLNMRMASAVSETKILSAFVFLESFCDRHLKRRDYVELFSLSNIEAECLNRYRNDLIHRNTDPSEATARFENGISRSGSKLYNSMRDDVKAAKGLVALNFLFSLCDYQLLRWLGYEGLCQMFIPTNDGDLKRWQCE